MRWRRKERERDLDRELQSHLESEIEEQKDAGVSPDEARYAAQRAFGATTLIKEDTRAMWGWQCLEQLMQDGRHSFRMAARNPGFVAAAILTLALGIGANTAIFSAVYSVLLHPLQVDGLDRIIVLHSDAPGLNLRRFPLNPDSTHRLNQRHDLFDAVGGHRAEELIMTGFGDAQVVQAARTAGDLFRVLHAAPHLGRLYGSEESEPGKHRIAVVSYGFWQRVGGGSAAFLGQKLLLNGQPFDVIGVLPKSFQYPRATDIWLPMPSNDPLWHPASVITTIARLQPGANLARVNTELHTFAQSLGTPKGWSFTIVTQPLIEYLAGTLRPVLLILMAAVTFVLLIACANVASLHLVRATGRTREVAVRRALGAGRGTLVRQSLVDSVSIALVGGAVGVMVAYLIIDGLRAWQGETVPQLGQLRLDATVLAFAATTALLAGIVVGIVPALRSSNADIGMALKAAGRSFSADKGRHRLLRGFAVLQIALAFVLLSGSTLLIRSFTQLLKADPGFNPERLVSMKLTLPAERFSQRTAQLNFYRELQTRLNGAPGIEASALTTNLPFSENVGSSPFQIVGRPTAPDQPQPHAEQINVTSDYFRVMGIPLLRGRNFEPSDSAPTDSVVLIDAQLARQFFAGEDPIGKQIKYMGPPSTIIGVVGSTSQKEVGGAPKATAYYFLERSPRTHMTLIVRTSHDPSTLSGFVRGILAQGDAAIPITDVRTLKQVVTGSLSNRQLAVYILGAFAGLSLILAMLGIYGVLSYISRERTQEIGIRLALGALPTAVIAMTVKRGALLVGLGLVFGVAGAMLLTRFLSTLLYGIGPRDPVSLVVSAIVLALTGLAATWLPARRASRVDPLVALRCE